MAVRFDNPLEAVEGRFKTKARVPLHGHAHLRAEPADGSCPICGSTKVFRRKMCKGCYLLFPAGIPGIIEAQSSQGT